MIRIESEGLEDLLLDDWSDGFNCRQLDLGWPATRPVSSSRPLADGSDDGTAFVGPRVVSLQLDVWATADVTRRARLDRLAAFCHPGRRSELFFADPSDAPERRVLVRADSGSAPLFSPSETVLQVMFVGYTGLIEAAEVSEETVPPPSPAEGAPFDWEFPVVFPLAAPEPTVVTSAGSMGAWPTIRIDGPCDGPVVRCGDRVLAFPDLTVEAGHFLLIDASARTVLLDGVTDRRGALDLSVSSWWQLAPGDNDLLFVPARSGSPSAVTVTWRDSYFL